MANEYLQRTPTTSGNTRVFTWAGWVKLNDQNTTWLLTASPAKNNNTLLFVNSSGLITFFDRQGNDASTEQIRWDPQFRDMSSWNHIVINADTNILSSTDRVSCYVNGIEIQRAEGSSLLNNSVNRDTPGISQEFWRLNGAGYIHYIGAQLDNSLGTPNENQFTDVFYVDGQKIGPEAFGFYKDGKGYISGGTTNSTDYRYGQWVPRTPREVKNIINETGGGFGINGFYLPFNDSSNVGADFHCTPNSIIKLKGEDLPQPRNGAPETTDSYVSQLRDDPYASNLVLAVPGISTATGPNLIVNGDFDEKLDGWTAQTGATLTNPGGVLRITTTATAGASQGSIPIVSGARYTLSFRVRTDGTNFANFSLDLGGTFQYVGNQTSTDWVNVTKSFTANTTGNATLTPYKAISGWAEFDDIVFKQEDAPRDYSADIKGSGSNKTLTPNGNAGVGYELGNYYGSAMTFDGTGDYLRTTSNLSDFHFGTGDFTIESWIWKSANGSSNYDGLISLGTNGSATDGFFFEISATRGYFFAVNGNYLSYNSSPNTSQWNHVVVERYSDTTTIYLNGVAVATGTNIGSIPTNGTSLDIGTYAVGTGNFLYNGKIQDLRVYKGVAKYKGGFDVPKPYTPVNFEGDSWRTVSDTPQNNFATINRKAPALDANVSDGALTYTSGTANTRGVVTGTFGITTGKWYWEVRIGMVQAMPGIMGNGSRSTNNLPYPGGGGGGYHYSYFTDGDLYWTEGSGVNHPKYGDTYTVGDIIGVAVDGDNGTLTFYKNGVSQGIARSNLNSFDVNAWMPCVGDGSGSTGALAQINFGQNPTFSGTRTAGTYTDANGRGLFKYQPPDNHLALCEDNLPEPAIADPGEHFRTVLWSGDGNGGRSVPGVGFAPDLVWAKRRSAAASHFLFDSVRGAGKFLHSHSTAAEGDDATNTLISFDSDGFTSGNTNGMNQIGHTYVAWCWKAGGEAVENTDGTIHSKVSANQTAGFSIVTATMVSGVKTIGHGLEKTPKFIITKQTNGTTGWFCYHSALGATKNIRLDLTNTEATSSAIWNDTEPTSSVFTMGTGFGSGEAYVAYCWAEIEGFSKFGSYEGNGLSDGEFVYCGFKPHFIMLKIISPSGQERDWHIYDTARDPINQAGRNLRPSGDSAEITEPGIDFLSNGFKLTNSYTFSNFDQGKYIFAAFAESPFKTANAK